MVRMVLFSERAYEYRVPYIQSFPPGAVVQFAISASVIVYMPLALNSRISWVCVSFHSPMSLLSWASTVGGVFVLDVHPPKIPAQKNRRMRTKAPFSFIGLTFGVYKTWFI